MMLSAFRLTSRTTRYEQINHFYGTVQLFNHNFGGNPSHHARLFTSRSGKAYRKGRRRTATNVENKALQSPEPNRTNIKMAEGHSGNPSPISTTEAPRNWYSPIHGVKKWLLALKSSNEPPWKLVLLALVPKRYRYPRGVCSQMYSYEQGILIAQRLAIWTALVVIMVVYDETSPFELVGIRGPSMIPTMAADGSDLWFCRKYPTWLRQLYDTTTSTVLLSLIQPRLRHGSIVGFTHPDCPNSAIAMKRIVGLPGDRVQRYGQFVHLYTHQDPVGWGITWPTIYDSNHIWIKNLGTAWDVDKTESITNPSVEVMRTLVVPDGHVWIEADCPALGLDSRHFGPIPISWIRTRVISKVWPLQVSPLYPRWYHRPHPIPLDAETLMEYNVFYDTINNKPSTWQV